LTVKVRYKCLNCGICCNRLLIDRQGVRKGLPLLPDEVDIFEPEKVKPAIGIGVAPDDGDFEIILYQMTENSCPHHVKDGCSMWVFRATVCRAYPVMPVINSDRSVVLAYDFSCTALEKYQSKYPDDKIPWEIDSISREAKNARKLSSVTERVISEIDQAWIFDLNTEKWYPFSQLTE